MDNETEQIFKEQLGKLPSAVVDFISSTNWDDDLEEIGSLYNLSGDELYNFKREATLVLAGLVHPDAFGDMLEQEVGIKGAVLEAVVATVEQKIFAPVRPALVEFFDSEAGEFESQMSKVESGEKEGGDSLDSVTARNEAVQDLNTGLLRQSTDSQRQANSSVPPSASSSMVNGQMSNVPRKPDIAPDNLPTGEVESFLPNLAPKTSVETGEPTHPFEEKMKKVFTAGQQSMGDLAIEPAPQVPATQTPKSPPVYHADPYREAIE